MPIESRNTSPAADQQTSTRPITGAASQEIRRDGRQISLYGHRVADVTTHPAFRNTAQMLARVYDGRHDPTLQEGLTTATDTGSGGYSHHYCQAPKNWEEPVATEIRKELALWIL